MPRPLLDRHGEGIVQRLLCGVKVPKQADERGEDLARFGAIHGIRQLTHPFGRVLPHYRRVLMLRRSRDHTVANAVRLDKSNIKVERPRFHCNTWCQVPCPKGRGLSLAFHQPTAHAVDRHNPQPQVH